MNPNDDLEATCNEVVKAADRLKELLEEGATDDEIDAILFEVDTANVRLKQLLAEKLIQERGY